MLKTKTVVVLLGLFVVICGGGSGLLAPLSGQEPATEFSAKDLWQAAKGGELERVKEILDSGIEVDAKTDYQATALAFAAERGHLGIVKLLVERGADINNQDTFYSATPTSWARMGSHKEIVDYLKEKGGKENFGRKSSTAESKSNKANADKKTADSKPENAAEKPVFAETSPEARLADRKVSSVHWPQFRGTAARGVADGQNPPVSWDIESGDGLAWEAKLPGLGHSCPTVWADKIFLTSAISGAKKESIRIGNYGSVDSVDDPSEHDFIVVAINKNSGEILWNKTAVKAVPKVKRHLKSTHANPTVACNDSVVIAFFASEGLYCYSHDGELLWKQKLGFLDSGWFYDVDYQWGFAASPVIFEDTVIVQCDIQKNSFIAAYSIENGQQVWRTERDEIPGWSSPTIYFDGDQALVATNGTKAIRGYDAKTGKEVWSFAAENSEIVTPTPFVTQHKIIFTAGYSPIMPIYAISVATRGEVTLDKSTTSNDSVVWSHRRGGPYMPSPIAYGDYLYMCSNIGVLACYHIPSGEQVYKKRLKGKRSVSFVASPVAADGHLYFISENGQVLVVKAGPNFEQLHTNQTGMKVLASPAISEGMLFVRGQKSLKAFK